MFAWASRARFLRVAVAGTGGVAVIGATQALWLKSKYKRLPDALGPRSGVATFAQQARQLHAELMSKPIKATFTGAAAATTSAMRTGVLLHAQPAAHAASAQGDERRKNVLFVGDSLVTGVGQDPGSSRGPALPRAVAEFMARYLRVDVSWTAIGQTGASVTTLHSKLLPAVVEEVAKKRENGQQLDVVVVVCGLNDFKHAYMSRRNTVASFREDLATFVSAIQEETGVQSTIVLPALPVHCAPVFDGIWPAQPMVARLASWWDQEKERLAQHVRKVTFVQNSEADDRWSERKYWASDGIHPNDEGYRIWGEHIALSIAEQLLNAPHAASPPAA